MSELPPCPNCKSPYAYPSDALLMCPECGHEWNPEEETATAVDNLPEEETATAVDNLPEEEQNASVVKDANGNVLQNGDSVTVIKDLPVKGAPKPVIKAGTKAKNIRLVDRDHNIDCKIDGFGSMALKSEFVKKA